MTNRYFWKIFLQKALSIILLTLVVYSSYGQPMKEKPIREVIDEALDFSQKQSLRMALSLENQPTRLPQTIDKTGKLITCKSSWWVSGFFPGVLWYLYENAPSDEMKKWAQNYTLRVKDQQYTKDNHDVGFMIFCSFGNGYRITGDTSYLSVIKTASESLSTRFNPKVGCIRSWDYASWSKQWQYPVIIDNMMNLEMLMWAGKKFNTPSFQNIAKSHANKTRVNHYRPDNSSFHVVSYDTLSGKVEKRTTAQGFSNESSWARGQGWGLYGFTMMYRFTKDTAYLNKAQKIASFILHHPRLPEDKIPYWDFDAPDILHACRDASAAALICSALIELSQYVSKTDAQTYLKVAETQIRTLSSSEYTNAPGSNGNFILRHSVGHKPNNTEVDVPLTYADYYYVEALVRYKNLKFANKPKSK